MYLYYRTENSLCMFFFIRYKEGGRKREVLLFNDGFQKHIWQQLRRTDLQQVHIRIHHRVAKVALYVRHGLALYLQSITNP